MRSRGVARQFACLCLCLCLAVALAGRVCLALEPEDVFDEAEHHGGAYFTMVDEDGNVVMRTARRIVVGDEYINIDNNCYRVVAVDGDVAHATLVAKVVLADPPGRKSEGWLQRVNRLLRGAIPVQQDQTGEKKIAVYHSHGAESYIKGDGAESKDQGGGIVDVADSLSKALEEKGVEVIRSKETHVPHDAGAYQRSRRTVEEALKNNPDALIDVHRDAVPEEEYLEKVEGEERVQIQLVVGRQNQNIAQNREFAEGLKKVADEKYPGLVKGIFMARGNYNQDMSPRSVLIEVGSHTNSKAQAEESVDLFADVVNIYLYGGAEDGRELSAPQRTASNRSALRSVLWILLGLVLAVAAYLVISAGGFRQAWEKLAQFSNREFGDVFRRRKVGEGGDGDGEGS